MNRDMAAAEFAERLDPAEEQLLSDYLRDGAFHAMQAAWSVTRPTPSNVTAGHLLASLEEAVAMLRGAREIVRRHLGEPGS